MPGIASTSWWAKRCSALVCKPCTLDIPYSLPAFDWDRRRLSGRAEKLRNGCLTPPFVVARGAFPLQDGQLHPFAAAAGAKSDMPVRVPGLDWSSRPAFGCAKRVRGAPSRRSTSHCLSFIRLRSEVRRFPVHVELSQ